MNYSLHYKKLIERAPKIKPVTYITEGHHVVPRCIGGTDSDGIVYLTPEEHYIAHLLLVKIYPNEPRLIYAANMMTVNKENLQRTNNKRYGWLRKKFIAAARIINSNRKHTEITKQKISQYQKGRPKSENHRKKLAEANKLRKGIPRSSEVKAKLSAARKGKPGKKHTEEAKRKISEAKKGKKLKPGKKLSEEHKQKISKANKGRIHTKQALENMKKGRDAARAKKLLFTDSFVSLSQPDNTLPTMLQHCQTTNQLL